MSERTGDERFANLETMKKIRDGLRSCGHGLGDVHKSSNCMRCLFVEAVSEIIDARTAIRLLTAALTLRVNWSEQDCSECSAGTQCAAHAALEAGRKWSDG